MRKKILGSKKREGLLFLERLLVVLMVVSVSLIFTNSFLNITTSYGTTYHYTTSPFEREKAFEEKEIFHVLLKGNINQIAQYVVICHDMETNGKYDTQKKIDITEYANRTKNVIGEQVTASYYLDDLVKWGNYGFTYKTVVGTWAQLNQIFIHNTETDVQQDIVTEMPGLKEYEGSLEDNASKLGLEAGKDNIYAMEILIPRYQTVEGKDLLQYASSVDEYEILKENLIYSAQRLFLDYTKYIEMQQKYSQEQTNIGYCFQVQGKNGVVYYSNSDMKFQGKKVDDITAQIKDLKGKFIYFNPDKVQINTNTNFTAAQMRSILKQYEYTFTDNTRVWFWVDKKYSATDDLNVAREELQKIMPYFGRLVGGAAVSFVLIILILAFLSSREGKQFDEEGEILFVITKQDKFPLELLFLLAVGGELLLFERSFQLLNAYRNGTINYAWLPAVLGLLMFVANEIFIRTYFSILRRVRAKKIWETTLVRMIGKKTKTFLIRTYDNGGLVTRTWIPYFIFLMVNLILVLLGVGGVAGAFLLDMLVGVYLYRENKAREGIVEGIEIIKNGEVRHQIDTSHLHGDNLKLANSVNSIGIGIRKAVESSMKDEKLKTDLITNVSHDIKTPLTSIITYVDLLKREQIEDERIAGYLEVLDNKSQRLKQLIDDLVDASKISSGNINIQIETINFVELVRQAIGEFYENFEEKNLQVVCKLSETPLLVEADSSQLWRVMENLFQNIFKYAMSGTRVYVEMEEMGEGPDRKAVFSAKNISANLLEVNAEDLTERFIRGDESRQTEGSGLGLSIAKNLVEAQGGEFEIQVDGDLFKVMISFLIC